MTKARVLIVDDSAVIRRLIREALTEDTQVEVVGGAANGRIALEMLNQYSPDLVTLDIEMPELDGLQTLKLLRKTHPRLPVIMFSTLTERGALATLDCLALGANDYVLKPDQAGSLDTAKERVREQLLPRIKVLCHLNSTGAMAPPPQPPSRPPTTAKTIPVSVLSSPGVSRRIDIVAIGCSTGGPNALASLLPTLPAEFPVPVVVVQHMPPTFTRFLAQRLDGNCAISVREAVEGERLLPGTAWIAPGDFHLKIAGTAVAPVLRIDQTPPQNSCRPSVDVLFSSLATLYGGNVLAVVLTGMGQDGLHGCQELRPLGARVVVQDESTSVVWGMPGFIARANLADRILPLPEIGGEIVRIVNSFPPLGRPAASNW